MNWITTAPTVNGGQHAKTTRFSVEAHWWLFCLLILALTFVLLALDPLPKLFLGDSGSYLWTAIKGWIPHDRSFLYGYVIRWSSLGTESLSSLLILQSFLGAITSILVAIICRWIFELSFPLSYLFAFLCVLDPLQVVWQRYVMTETISLFFYILMLLLSFLYLKQRRLWQLLAIQVVAVLVISFRMSYLIVVQISTLLLPLVAFFPEIRAALWKRSSAASRMSVARSTGLHLAASVLLMFILQQGYQRVNGWLAGRPPAYLHSSGLTLLAVWAPALEPTDSPDPRLAELIAHGDQLHLKDVRGRNAQLYMPGYLVKSWKDIEPNAAVRNQVAKQTALHALFHHPLRVLKLGAETFLGYLDYPETRKRKKEELKTTYPWNTKLTNWAARFHMVPPRREHANKYTLLQRYHFIAQPYYYVVLLSPLVCGWLLFFIAKPYSFLLFIHSWLLLGTITLLATGPNTRYLQPMSLLTILIFAALVKSVIDRRSRSASAAAVNPHRI
jgi:hypothetical protein